MINPKEIATEVALIIFGGYAIYSIFYVMIDVTISLIIFIITGKLESFLTNSFHEASMMCPIIPFCILDWHPKTPMLGLNSILKSILSVQHSFGGRIAGAVSSALIFSLLIVLSLKKDIKIFVKSSRVENMINLAAVLAITALFLPTMVAFLGGFALSVIKILGWD